MALSHWSLVLLHDRMRTVLKFVGLVSKLLLARDCVAFSVVQLGQRKLLVPSCLLELGSMDIRVF